MNEMLDYKAAEEILKEDELDFYRSLELEHPDGFPVSKNTLAYWQELGEKEYPEDFSILSCSKLDAFSFYVGVKYFKEQCCVDNDNVILDKLVIAIELGNYQALKLACNSAFSNPNFLENYFENASCIYIADQLRDYYGPAGDMYLAKIYGAYNQLNDALLALYNVRKSGWEENKQYDALKKYDPDINLSADIAIRNLENQLDDPNKQVRTLPSVCLSFV